MRCYTSSLLWRGSSSLFVLSPAESTTTGRGREHSSLCVAGRICAPAAAAVFCVSRLIYNSNIYCVVALPSLYIL
uniref:Putative secreted peptide n=1 Tax=Anopheles braziliensis TaxID=58242 RepID=A0A2M3ZUI3_9DIPT